VFATIFPALVPPFQQLTVIVRSDVVLKDAYRNDNPVFGPYYDAGRPLNHVTGITRANPHQLVDIAARDLFAKLAAPVSNNTYYYYSGNIQHVEALVEDILPFDVMLQLDASGADQNVNVWFGMSGVTGTRPKYGNVARTELTRDSGQSLRRLRQSLRADTRQQAMGAGAPERGVRHGTLPLLAPTSRAVAGGHASTPRRLA
jgi:hypothetical protein